MWQSVCDRTLDEKVRVYPVWIKRMHMTRKQCWKPVHQNVYNISFGQWSYKWFLFTSSYLCKLQQTCIFLCMCGKHSSLFCCQSFISNITVNSSMKPISYPIFSCTSSLHLNLFQVGSLPKTSPSWPEEVSAASLKKRQSFLFLFLKNVLLVCIFLIR